MRNVYGSVRAIFSKNGFYLAKCYCVFVLHRMRHKGLPHFNCMISMCINCCLFSSCFEYDILHSRETHKYSIYEPIYHSISHFRRCRHIFLVYWSLQYTNKFKIN